MFCLEKGPVADKLTDQREHCARFSWCSGVFSLLTPIVGGSFVCHINGEMLSTVLRPKRPEGNKERMQQMNNCELLPTASEEACKSYLATGRGNQSFQSKWTVGTAAIF